MAKICIKVKRTQRYSIKYCTENHSSWMSLCQDVFFLNWHTNQTLWRKHIWPVAQFWPVTAGWPTDQPLWHLSAEEDRRHITAKVPFRPSYSVARHCIRQPLRTGCRPVVIFCQFSITSAGQSVLPRRDSLAVATNSSRLPGPPALGVGSSRDVASLKLNCQGLGKLRFSVKSQEQGAVICPAFGNLCELPTKLAENNCAWDWRFRS